MSSDKKDEEPGLGLIVVVLVILLSIGGLIWVNKAPEWRSTSDIKINEVIYETTAGNDFTVTTFPDGVVCYRYVRGKGSLDCISPVKED